MKYKSLIITVFFLVFGIYNIAWKSTLFTIKDGFVEIDGEIVSFEYTKPPKQKKRKWSTKNRGYYEFKINNPKYEEKLFSDYYLYKIQSDFEMWPFMKEGTSVSMHVKKNDLSRTSNVYIYSFSVDRRTIIEFNQKFTFDIKYFLLGMLSLLISYFAFLNFKGR